jgi:hypothetical protein
VKRRDVGGRIDRVADYIGLAPAILGSVPTAGGDPEILAELRRIAGEEPGLRTDAEVARLVDAERAAWGKARTPQGRATLAAIRKVVSSPDPAAFTSADAYALAFAAWLTESDRDLAEKGARQ